MLLYSLLMLYVRAIEGGTSPDFASTDAIEGETTILPSSYSGSPRQQHMRFAHALHLASCYGRPTDYTTFTCNPRWPEITEALADHETAATRPDITARVFRGKLRVFLQRYTRGRYHGGRKCHYVIMVIEFQWRKYCLFYSVTITYNPSLNCLNSRRFATRPHRCSV